MPDLVALARSAQWRKLPVRSPKYFYEGRTEEHTIFAALDGYRFGIFPIFECWQYMVWYAQRAETLSHPLKYTLTKDPHFFKEAEYKGKGDETAKSVFDIARRRLELRPE